MNIVKLAEQYTDIRFCIAHAARFEKNVFDYLTDNGLKNIFLDTSPFLSITKLTPLDIERGVGGCKLNLSYNKPMQALVELCQIAPEFVVWGTDEPWTTITDDHQGKILLKAKYEDEVSLLQSLPENLKKKIAHDNSTRFLFGE